MGKKKNFYAVKVGKVPGIYQSWDEASPNVTNISGSVYSGFRTLEEAEKYMNSGIVSESLSTKEALSNETICEMIKNQPEKQVIAFVDGSFSDKISKYSFGVVLLYNNKEQYLYNSYNDEIGLKYNNFSGEIRATKEAILWSIDKEFDKIIIFHDYEGIQKFASGEYKARNEISIDYYNFIIESRKKITIEFISIESHSGIVYNDKADKLAKDALIKNKFSSRKDGSLYITGLTYEKWIDILDEINSRDIESLNLPEISRIVTQVNDGHKKIVLTRSSDKVVINIYGQINSYIQGKPSILTEELIEVAVSKLDNEDQARVVLNRYHSLQITEEEVNLFIGHKMPNVHLEKVDVKIQIVIRSAVYNYLITSNMPDYTCLVSPIFRILEYSLHLILGRLGNNTTYPKTGTNNFSFFNYNGKKYVYNRRVKDAKFTVNHLNCLNNIYNYYNKIRHIYSHWSNPSLGSGLITDSSKARVFMDEGYKIIDDFFMLFI